MMAMMDVNLVTEGKTKTKKNHPGVINLRIRRGEKKEMYVAGGSQKFALVLFLFRTVDCLRPPEYIHVFILHGKFFERI